MRDLVQKLRAANTWLNEGDCCGQLDASGTCMAPACIFGEALKMANEAADRIEQLENALTEIYKKGLHNQGGAYKNGFYDCFKIARRALGIPHMSFDAARAALEDKP